ncbi:MAG: hypothetical protein ABJQ69_03550 [Ekhidna sp.]
MKFLTTHWLIIGGVTLAGGGAAAYFFWYRKRNQSDKYGNQILGGKSQGRNTSGGLSGGIRITSATKGRAVSEPNWDNSFDMNFATEVKNYLAPKRVYELPDAKAKQFAQQIYKAKGKGIFSNDNEEAVKAVFEKRLQDKVQVANLSRAFWHLYKKDMWVYLKGFLSSSELSNYVKKPVRKLPNYRLA